jgi:adenine deaminase
MKSLIRYARGARPADLLLKNCRLVNVLTSEIYPASVAVALGHIVGFGDYPAKKTIDLKAAYLAPGFIEGHIHIESSMLSPAEFSRVVLPRGTTSLVCDPHEMANIIGLKGIEYFLKANRRGAPSIYVMLPSCVPATHLETSGARLSARHLIKFARHPYVLGLAEMMNFPGVLYENKEVADKLGAFSRIDGHAPGLQGRDLYAYISAGIRSDHESVTVAEAREKLRSGMYLMLREGTAAKNLETLIKAVTPQNSRRCLLVSDDRHPADLLKSGHLVPTLKKAVRLGLNPITAIQMVTINTAEYFGLKNLGAITPGFRADLVVLEDLKDFKIKMVFKQGRPAVRTPKPQKTPLIHNNTIRLPHLNKSDFEIRMPAGSARRIRVIELIPHQIITREKILPALIKNGQAGSDSKRDILKIAVIDRHTGKKSVGLGFVRGFGLKHGAIGSTVAHDSHNLIVVGDNDNDMLKAVEAIRRMKGGQAVAGGGRIRALLPLPIAGIMSTQTAQEVARGVQKLNHESHKLGCKITEPFMALSFLALPVIPALKITDKGLVDTAKFQIVSLFE